MTPFYFTLHAHRPQDGQYWTFGLRIEAETLTQAAAQLDAFSAGYLAASGAKITMEQVSSGTKPRGGYFYDFANMFHFTELQTFLKGPAQ